MKKFLPLMFAFAALFMTACKPSPEKIAEKIANDEPLSEQEYTVAFDYTDKVLEIINDSIEQNKGDFQALVRSLKNINAAYPESDKIMTKLMTTDPSTLDEKNRKLYDRLMKHYESMAEIVANEGPMTRANFDNGASVKAEEKTEPADTTFKVKSGSDEKQLKPEDTGTPGDAAAKVDR